MGGGGGGNDDERDDNSRNNIGNVSNIFSCITEVAGSVRAAQAKEELLWTALAPQPREEEKSISYL